MMLRRSTSVMEQIREATILRESIIRRIKSEFPHAETRENEDSTPEHELLRLIELSAEGFALDIERRIPDDADRLAWMLGGPFFTSTLFPVPVGQHGSMLPLLQIDLGAAGQVIGESFPDCLLQVWYDTQSPYQQDSVEFFYIPRAHAVLENLTPFDFQLPDEFDGFPITGDLIFDPAEPDGLIIRGLESVGVQCQGGYIDVYAAEIEGNISDELLGQLRRYDKLTSVKSSLQLFGSFYPIQYSAVEVGQPPLFTFPDWGSQGNAQVFYKQYEDGDLSCYFRSCVR